MGCKIKDILQWGYFISQSKKWHWLTVGKFVYLMMLSIAKTDRVINE
jgi:hypothetical protein